MKIDNDGLHGNIEKNTTFTITNAPTVRKIRVEYFEATGSATLIVRYQFGTNGLKQVIPASAWVPFLDYWNLEVSTRKKTTSCELPTLYEFCNATNYGCMRGYTCDQLSRTCRVPIQNESCLPLNGTSYGCGGGYLCNNSVCVKPALDDACVSAVGCIAGYFCNPITQKCSVAPPSTLPVCSSASPIIYLAPENCRNISYSNMLKQIEVAFCDTNAIAGIRIYEFNASATLSYNLYGLIGGVWTFLINGNAIAAANLSSMGKNYFEVKFPSASYPKYRLTLSTFQGFTLPSVKFLQSFITNCENRFVFETKAALQLAVDAYTSDEATKKQMIDKFGAMICWNVARITDMSNLFYNKTLFDEDISCWDCSNVRNMSRMFYNAQSFKGDLGRWDLSNVEDMSEMFFGATSFASSVVSWNVSKVKSAKGLFYKASSFNQDLCPWYNRIGSSVFTDNMFSFSGCNDRSTPNVTSKTSFCKECSCCGGSCFNPVGVCEIGYSCNESTKLCVKPVEPEYCRIRTGESYGCQDFYECRQLVKYTTPTCTKPFLGSVCKQSIGCFDGLVCSNEICVRPSFYEYCNSTNYGCSPGLTCDSSSLSCRIPSLNEPCLPSIGCTLGLLCPNNVNLLRAGYILPTSVNDTCIPQFGCDEGLPLECKETKSITTCLAVDGIPVTGALLPVSGADVLLKDCTSGYQLLYDKYARAFRVQRNPDYCLDVFSIADAKIVTNLCSGKASQQWVVDMSPSRQWVKPASNESLCLSFEGQDMSQANGKKLYLYPCVEGKESQMWGNGLNSFDNSVLYYNVLVLYYPWTNACSNNVCFQNMSGWNILGGESLPNINMVANTGKIGGSGFSDNIAAAYTGYVQFSFNGMWTIFIESDDGSKLYVDDFLLINNDGLRQQGSIEKNATVTISNAPTVRKIRVEYFEATGSATLIVRYQLGTFVPKQVIPASAWVPFIDYWILKKVQLATTCQSNVCNLPNLNDMCVQGVGCVLGYTCDFFTNRCRKPIESEFCLPQDVSNFGCQDGLQCTNVNLLARATSATGNILAKFYNLPSNTTVLPNFDTLTLYFVTYVKNIAYVGNGVQNVGVVYEGNLRFPLNGTWIIYVTSNAAGYNLLANNVSMVTSNGNVNETSNPIYIATSNQTNKIRLEFFDSLGNSSIKLQWLSPGVNQTRTDIPSSLWDLGEYSCNKPLGQAYSNQTNRRALISGTTRNLVAACGECQEKFGCLNGLYCVNTCCVRPKVTQQCITQIGCLPGLTCDANFTVCRKPAVNETCEDAIGCQEGLFCKNKKCLKPALNERCIETVGCFDDGAVCKLTTSTGVICRKPTKGEPCSLKLGCSVGFVCDQTMKTCRLPKLSETCDKDCADGYKCKSGKCFLPIVPDSCVPSIGCETGYICKSTNTSSSCQIPILGEKCISTVGCGDLTLLCEWVEGLDKNYCRYKKFAGEDCRTNDDCRSSLNWAPCQVGTNKCAIFLFYGVEQKLNQIKDGFVSYGNLQDFAGGGGLSLSTARDKVDTDANPNPNNLISCCSQWTTSTQYACIGYSNNNYICITAGGCDKSPWDWDWELSYSVTPCYRVPPMPVYAIYNYAITLHGNTWKAFKLNSPYIVTSDSVLLFSFHLTTQAEGHAICVDEEGNYETFGGLRRRCIAVSGTQKYNNQWEDQLILDGDSFRVGKSERYVVPLGTLFDTSAVNIINYIALIQDNDNEPKKGESSFQDITFTKDSFYRSSVFVVFLCELEDYKGTCYGKGVGVKPTYFDNWVSSIKVLPGYKITVYYDANYGGKSTTYTSNTAKMGEFAKQVSSFKVEKITAIDSCTCLQNRNGAAAFDFTGRPTNFRATQDNGYVRFTFTDNSKCEEAFSFTRSLFSEEFVSRVSEKGVSFTSDYYVKSKNACGGVISPQTEAADDLRTSNLVVGHMVTYCVRAIAEKYIEYPSFEKSSDDACTNHRVLWEASISGKVTTSPNAGRAPIKDVFVIWHLLDPSEMSVVLEKGSDTSSDGGSFEIKIKSGNAISRGLVETNDVVFPVKVTFFKQLGNKDGDNHMFLCNDGQDDCSQDGTIVYLKHLQFNEPLHVYDNSASLFTGTLRVQGTFCPIFDAEVCLYEKTTTGLNAELVCGKTDDKGFYSVGVVIGSTVHTVVITYHSHTFVLAPTNSYNYDAGVSVEAGNTYSNNDFEDITTGSLTVEIVGGKCDRRLGRSTIQVQIVGCPSSAKKYYQGGPIKKHVFPAHMLSVQVRRLQMFEFFQGSSPQERLFNLTNATVQASAGFDTSVLPGNDAQASKIRFQYDGELQIKFSIERSKEKMDQSGSCPQGFKERYSLTGDSVHVIESNTLFKFRVDLLFQIIPEEGVTCDMVDDSVKLRIFSQVGANRITEKVFLNGISDNITKEALLHCSEGCLVNITNDTSGHNAGVDYSLFTGRPNIIPPYSKGLFLQVIGVAGEVTYTASIIVTGDYSKGPGQSFALPTHYPVMILRDPPGGLSYASYQNVVTKFWMNNYGGSTSLYFGHEAALNTKSDLKVDACVGGGFGVIALACKEIAKGEVTGGIKSKGKSGALLSYSDQTSNEISTTWSFQTSQDPWLAGEMSDVFVVPNLNVLYQIVTRVSWNAVSCDVSTKDEVLFNLNAPENKPAMAFYSRWHILNVKLPELQHALDVEAEEKKRKTLQEGIDGWQAALNKASETARTKTRLSEQFKIDGVESKASLVSPSLLDKAESLSNSLPKAPIKDINRLQFSGGGNTYTLTMSQEKSFDHVFTSDVTILELETALAAAFEGEIFGIGFEGSLDYSISVDIHFMYSQQDTDTTSTEVSIVLGDDDLGDEFVVELFRDNRYGSFIFETIAGQSSCPGEAKTASNLDPRIALTSLPSSVVMPDQAILFEVELANLGVGSGDFVLLADDNSNYEELSLSYYSSPITLESNERVTKLIQVNIGPRLFQYKPVNLFFREACYDGVNKQRDEFTLSPLVTLQNVQNEKGSFLQFVEPCSEVEWAGEFKRDQSFLINKQSDNVDELQILIRNSDFSSGKLQEKERLESIFLWYRRVGDVVWNKALGKVSDGEAMQTKELNLFKYGKEDNYGFITNLKWLLRAVVIEGTYEIKVQCECFAAGGPKDYDVSSTMPLIGVYDVTAPKLFGSPLPLDDVVLIGEEITFVFTEPLQCSKPYSFDVEMRLYGSSTRNIPLQVTCEGNHVSLQVDQDKYNVANLMGKKFVVEIGSIGSQSLKALTDTNGNPLENNVKLNKTFANLDLSQASTSFEFVLDNVTCTDSTVGALQDKIRESIRVILGMSSIERIQVIDLNCVDNKNKVAATVSIIPPSAGSRRFLSSNNKEDDNSVTLVYALQDASAEKKHISRMLSTGVHDSISNNHFIVRGIKISPGLADVALLTKNATVLQKEKKIRNFEKTFYLKPFKSNEMNDLASHLLEELTSISEASLKERAENLEEMRAMKATYEAKMLEHEHLYEAELKKMHEEEVKMLHELSLKASHETDSMEMKTMFLEMKVVMVATICLAVGLLFLLKR